MSTPNEQAPDLAKRLVFAVSDKGCGCYERYFDPDLAEEAVRAVLAASPELAQVREALEKAMLETTPAIPYDFGIPAVADACRDALAVLDALTGKATP